MIAKSFFLRQVQGIKCSSVNLIKQIVLKLKLETRIRNGYLYHEGDPAKYVYLVKEGQFIVSKKLVWTGGKDNKCEAVSAYKNGGNNAQIQRIESKGMKEIPNTIETLKNPARSKRLNNQMFIKNTNCESKGVDIELVTKYGILGDDDVGRESAYYQTSV